MGKQLREDGEDEKNSYSPLAEAVSLELPRVRRMVTQHSQTKATAEQCWLSSEERMTVLER